MDRTWITVFICGIFITSVYSQSELRWCVTKEAEYKKCMKLSEKVEEVRNLNQTAQGVLNYYKRNAIIDFSNLPMLKCVTGNDIFVCLDMIDRDEPQADVISLEAGHGYFAGRYHSLMPIMAEKYTAGPPSPSDDYSYYAVAVKKKSGIPLNMGTSLQNKRLCVPGIGTGAGWIYPISYLLKESLVTVEECNAVVKTVTDFFGDSCIPGALNSFYNPFGNNPTHSCVLCGGPSDRRCTTSDVYGGYDGAFRCLRDGAGDLAFLRHDTVQSMAEFNTDEYDLICKDGTNRPISEYENSMCNFGKIPNNIVMASSLSTTVQIKMYKNFLEQLDAWFGTKAGTPYQNKIHLYRSDDPDFIDDIDLTDRRDLMFSDVTQSLVDVGAKDKYYNWVDDTFNSKLGDLKYCPLPVARFCVITEAEIQKCEKMVEAFRGKDLMPELDCMQGNSVTECMEMIDKGDAHLMALDAGDVYLAGEKYGLVPIAAEDYGDGAPNFRVVAVTRKNILNMTLFNLKGRRGCMAGIGRGDGWIIPLNIYIETQQFIPQQCTIFENIGQLFARSCIPGALDESYNPNGKPISLCEGCAAGNDRRCQRNAREQYFGTAGAFRCMVEFGGDVAFVRHLTASGNTDGRNHAIWARNRRSDDYELLCKDGTRTDINNWGSCYLGTVPANAIVTASYTSDRDRLIFWRLLEFGQQFFSSDIDGDFHLFDSGLFYSDLIFSDEAVRLTSIERDRQTHEAYLGYDFINQIKNLEQYTCTPVTSGGTFVTINLVMLLLVTFIGFLL